MRKHTINAAGTPSAIVMRYSFTNSSGSLCGGYVTRASEFQFGSLPQQFVVRYKNACTDKSTYVVWSYMTPIAWHTIDDDGNRTWTAPDHFYGSTTQRHQALVRQAIDRENDAAVQYGYAKSVIVTNCEPTLCEGK